MERHLNAIVDVNDGGQPADCPTGRWEGETFVIQDGRHRYVALVVAGFDHMLVRWLERLH